MADDRFGHPGDSATMLRKLKSFELKCRSCIVTGHLNSISENLSVGTLVVHSGKWLFAGIFRIGLQVGHVSGCILDLDWLLYPRICVASVSWVYISWNVKLWNTLDDVLIYNLYFTDITYMAWIMNVDIGMHQSFNLHICQCQISHIL